MESFLANPSVDALKKNSSALKKEASTIVGKICTQVDPKCSGTLSLIKIANNFGSNKEFCDWKSPRDLTKFREFVAKHASVLTKHGMKEMDCDAWQYVTLLFFTNPKVIESLEENTKKMGGASQLVQQMKDFKEEKKALLRQYNAEITEAIEEMSAIAKKIAYSVPGKSVNIPENVLERLNRAFTSFPQVGDSDIFYRVSGVIQDDSNKYEINGFLAKLQAFKETVEGVSIPEFADLARVTGKMIEIIQRYNRKFREHDPSVVGGAVRVVTANGKKLQHAMDVLVYTIKQVGILKGMKHSANIMEGMSGKYNEVLGAAIATEIKNERERASKFLSMRGKANPLHFGNLGAMMPSADDNRELTDEEERAKEINNRISESRVGILKVAEAVDLYLMKFTQTIDNNPGSLKSLMHMLENIEIINEWNNKVGDDLGRIFDTFPSHIDGAGQRVMSKINGVSQKAPYYVRVAAACGLDSNDDALGIYGLKNEVVDAPLLPGNPLISMNMDYYEDMYDRVNAVLNKSPLKNLLSIFVAFGFQVETTMKPKEIYNALIDYATAASFSVNYKENRVKTAIEGYDSSVNSTHILDIGESYKSNKFYTGAADEPGTYAKFQQLCSNNLQNIKVFIAGANAKPAGLFDKSNFDSAIKYIEKTLDNPYMLYSRIYDAGTFNTAFADVFAMNLNDNKKDTANQPNTDEHKKYAKQLFEIIACYYLPPIDIDISTVATNNIVDKYVDCTKDNFLRTLKTSIANNNASFGMVTQFHKFSRKKIKSNMTDFVKYFIATDDNTRNPSDNELDAFYDKYGHLNYIFQVADDAIGKLKFLERVFPGSIVVKQSERNNVIKGAAEPTMDDVLSLRSLPYKDALSEAKRMLMSMGPEREIKNDVVKHMLMHITTSDTTQENWNFTLRPTSRFASTNDPNSLTDDLFAKIIKAMIAKVFVAVGVHNLFEHPSTEVFDPNLRLVLGADETVRPVPEITELYLRLVLLAEFYKKLFPLSWTEPSRRISFIHERNSLFGKFLDIIHESTGQYSNYQVQKIVEEVNKIYANFSKSNDPIKDSIHAFINFVNSRLGSITAGEVERYQKQIEALKNLGEMAIYTDVDLGTVEGYKGSTIAAPSKKFETPIEGLSTQEREKMRISRAFELMDYFKKQISGIMDVTGAKLRGKSVYDVYQAINLSTIVEMYTNDLKRHTDPRTQVESVTQMLNKAKDSLSIKHLDEKKIVRELYDYPLALLKCLKEVYDTLVTKFEINDISDAQKAVDFGIAAVALNASRTEGEITAGGSDLLSMMEDLVRIIQENEQKLILIADIDKNESKSIYEAVKGIRKENAIKLTNRKLNAALNQSLTDRFGNIMTKIIINFIASIKDEIAHKIYEPAFDEIVNTRLGSYILSYVNGYDSKTNINTDKALYDPIVLIHIETGAGSSINGIASRVINLFPGTQAGTIAKRMLENNASASYTRNALDNNDQVIVQIIREAFPNSPATEALEKVIEDKEKALALAAPGGAVQKLDKQELINAVYSASEHVLPMIANVANKDVGKLVTVFPDVTPVANIATAATPATALKAALNTIIANYPVSKNINNLTTIEAINAVLNGMTTDRNLSSVAPKYINDYTLREIVIPFLYPYFMTKNMFDEKNTSDTRAILGTMSGKFQMERPFVTKDIGEISRLTKDKMRANLPALVATCEQFKKVCEFYQLQMDLSDVPQFAGVVEFAISAINGITKASEQFLRDMGYSPVIGEVKNGFISEYLRDFKMTPYAPLSGALPIRHCDTYFGKLLSSDTVLPEKHLFTIQSPIDHNSELGRHFAAYSSVVRPGVTIPFNSELDNIIKRLKINVSNVAKQMDLFSMITKFLVLHNCCGGDCGNFGGEDLAQKIVRLIESPKPDFTVFFENSKTTDVDRSDLIVYNIMDMNICPINMYSLMKEFPLVNLFNYANSFNKFVEDTYAGSMAMKEIADFLILPYGQTSTPHHFLGFPIAPGSGMPNPVSINLFNGPLFGELLSNNPNTEMALQENAIYMGSAEELGDYMNLDYNTILITKGFGLKVYTEIKDCMAKINGNTIKLKNGVSKDDFMKDIMKEYQNIIELQEKYKILLLKQERLYVADYNKQLIEILKEVVVVFKDKLQSNDDLNSIITNINNIINEVENDLKQSTELSNKDYNLVSSLDTNKYSYPKNDKVIDISITQPVKAPATSDNFAVGDTRDKIREIFNIVVDTLEHLINKHCFPQICRKYIPEYVAGIYLNSENGTKFNKPELLNYLYDPSFTIKVCNGSRLGPYSGLPSMMPHYMRSRLACMMYNKLNGSANDCTTPALADGKQRMKSTYYAPISVSHEHKDHIFALDMKPSDFTEFAHSKEVLNFINNNLSYPMVVYNDVLGEQISRLAHYYKTYRSELYDLLGSAIIFDKCGVGAYNKKVTNVPRKYEILVGESYKVDDLNKLYHVSNVKFRQSLAYLTRTETRLATRLKKMQDKLLSASVTEQSRINKKITEINLELNKVKDVIEECKNKALYKDGNSANLEVEYPHTTQIYGFDQNDTLYSAIKYTILATNGDKVEFNDTNLCNKHLLLQLIDAYDTFVYNYLGEEDGNHYTHVDEMFFIDTLKYIYGNRPATVIIKDIRNPGKYVIPTMEGEYDYNLLSTAIYQDIPSNMLAERNLVNPIKFKEFQDIMKGSISLNKFDKVIQHVKKCLVSQKQPIFPPKMDFSIKFTSGASKVVDYSKYKDGIAKVIGAGEKVTIYKLNLNNIISFDNIAYPTSVKSISTNVTPAYRETTDKEVSLALIGNKVQTYKIPKSMKNNAMHLAYVKENGQYGKVQLPSQQYKNTLGVISHCRLHTFLTKTILWSSMLMETATHFIKESQEEKPPVLKGHNAIYNNSLYLPYTPIEADKK